MRQTGRVSLGNRAVVAAVLTTVAVIALVVVSGTAAGTVETGLAAQQETPTADNETTQHERPSNVSESGDTAAVSGWLERRLTQQLADSSVAISEGQYEQAQQVVGDEYDSRLEQYVDVAGDTDASADDQAAQAYQETRDAQRAYAAAAQNYTDTYQQYQQARAAGNATAARAAARRLERQSERLTELNESLTTRYDRIENLTGVDTSRAQQAITNQTEAIRTQQAAVRAATFVETRLVVRTNRSTVAFDRPMGITGQLTTTNGSAVGNRSIRVAVATRQYQVRTAANGTFHLAYRPVTLPVNASQVTVTYQPAVQAPYLGTAAAVAADVQQVSPQVAVQTMQTPVGYGERVPVRVRVTAAGRSVPGLPVRVNLGTATAVGRTNTTGVARLTLPLPAGVDPGTAQLRVRQPRRGLAIGPATARTPLTVTSTPTTLSLTAAPRGSVVRLTGRLQTDSGRGIPGQTVTVAVGDGAVRSVVTNDTGWYALTVPLNETARGSDTNTSVSVLARFDGDGTNLGTARAQTQFIRPASDAGGSGSSDGGPGSSDGGPGSSDGGPGSAELVWGALGVLLLLVAGAGWWIRDSDDTPTEAPASSSVPAESVDADQHSGTPWLEQARAAVDDDTDQAAVAAYAAVRDQLSKRGGLSASLTHREFVAVCVDEFDELNPALLQTVVDAYETAAFAPTVEHETATEAVEAADRLLSGPDSRADD